MTLKLLSWNVNGLRSCVNKGFQKYFDEAGADIFCVQETKLQEGQISLEFGDEYKQYWNYAIKKGLFWNRRVYKTRTPFCKLWSCKRNGA